MPLHSHCNERQTNNMEVKIILVGFSLNCVLSLNVKLIFPFNFKVGAEKGKSAKRFELSEALPKGMKNDRAD